MFLSGGHMIYTNIRNLREDNDLKQSDIAHVLNLSQSSYSKREIGAVEFTASELIILSEFYNVSIDFLLAKRD